MQTMENKVIKEAQNTQELSGKYSRYKNLMIVFVVLFVAVTVICGVLLYLCFDMNDENGSYASEKTSLESRVSSLESVRDDLKSERDDLEAKVKSLESDNKTLSEKADFLDSYICFGYHDGLYHKFDCSDFSWKSGKTFIDNIGCAKEAGYTECPKCH